VSWCTESLESGGDVPGRQFELGGVLKFKEHGPAEIDPLEAAFA
jgi:hypothetical protein